MYVLNNSHIFWAEGNVGTHTGHAHNGRNQLSDGYMAAIGADRSTKSGGKGKWVEVK